MIKLPNKKYNMWQFSLLPKVEITRIDNTKDPSEKCETECKTLNIEIAWLFFYFDILIKK